jgi:hypothetical protein
VGLVGCSADATPEVEEDLQLEQARHPSLLRGAQVAGVVDVAGVPTAVELVLVLAARGPATGISQNRANITNGSSVPGSSESGRAGSRRPPHHPDPGHL